MKLPPLQSQELSAAGIIITGALASGDNSISKDNSTGWYYFTARSLLQKISNFPPELALRLGNKHIKSKRAYTPAIRTNFNTFTHNHAQSRRGAAEALIIEMCKVSSANLCAQHLSMERNSSDQAATIAGSQSITRTHVPSRARYSRTYFHSLTPFVTSLRS